MAATPPGEGGAALVPERSEDGDAAAVAAAAAARAWKMVQASPLAWLIPSWLSAGAASEGGPSKPTLLATLGFLVLPALLSSSMRGMDQRAHSYAVSISRFLHATLHGEEYTRTISSGKRFNSYGYEISDRAKDGDRNGILQKALTLHIASLEPGLDFEDARVSLVKKLESKKPDGDSDDDENDGSVASQLKKFNVGTMPPPGMWVTVQRSPQVEFYSNVTTVKQGGGGESSGGITTVTTTFNLRARGRGADEAVSGFISDAYAAYIANMKENEDCSGRYMCE